MKQAPLWSPEQVEKLKELAGTMSCFEIGKIVGRSKDAVKNKIFSLDLPRYSTLIKKEVKRSHKKKVTPSPVVEAQRPPLIAVYKNHAPYKKATITETHSRLEWCKECGSPVADWIEHIRRLGCKRNAG